MHKAEKRGRSKRSNILQQTETNISSKKHRNLFNLKKLSPNYLKGNKNKKSTREKTKTSNHNKGKFNSDVEIKNIKLITIAGKLYQSLPHINHIT